MKTLLVSKDKVGFYKSSKPLLTNIAGRPRWIRTSERDSFQRDI